MGPDKQTSSFRLPFSLLFFLWKSVYGMYSLLLPFSLANEPVVPCGEAVTVVWVKAEASFELKVFIYSFVA